MCVYWIYIQHQIIIIVFIIFIIIIVVVVAIVYYSQYENCVRVSECMNDAEDAVCVHHNIELSGRYTMKKKLYCA